MVRRIYAKDSPMGVLTQEFMSKGYGRGIAELKALDKIQRRRR